MAWVFNPFTGNLDFSPSTLPRTTVIADGTTVAMNSATTDVATQANTQAIGNLTISAPTGTPVNGQRLVFRLTSTNVQTFVWNTGANGFAGSTDIPLPATSTGSVLGVPKTDYMTFMWNSTASKWQLVGSVFGF